MKPAAWISSNKAVLALLAIAAVLLAPFQEIFALSSSDEVLGLSERSAETRDSQTAYGISGHSGQPGDHTMGVTLEQLEEALTHSGLQTPLGVSFEGFIDDQMADAVENLELPVDSESVRAALRDAARNTVLVGNYRFRDQCQSLLAIDADSRELVTISVNGHSDQAHTFALTVADEDGQPVELTLIDFTEVKPDIAEEIAAARAQVETKSLRAFSSGIVDVPDMRDKDIGVVEEETASSYEEGASSYQVGGESLVLATFAEIMPLAAPPQSGPYRFNMSKGYAYPNTVREPLTAEAYFTLENLDTGAMYYAKSGENTGEYDDIYWYNDASCRSGKTSEIYLNNGNYVLREIKMPQRDGKGQLWSLGYIYYSSEQQPDDESYDRDNPLDSQGRDTIQGKNRNVPFKGRFDFADGGYYFTTTDSAKSLNYIIAINGYGLGGPACQSLSATKTVIPTEEIPNPQLDGYKLKISNLSKGTYTQVTSDSSGRFEFPKNSSIFSNEYLPLGTYTIEETDTRGLDILEIQVTTYTQDVGEAVPQANVETFTTDNISSAAFQVLETTRAVEIVVTNGTATAPTTPTSAFSIQKLVTSGDGQIGGKDQKFAFEITYQKDATSAVETFYEVLTGGQTRTFPEMPLGSYTIREMDWATGFEPVSPENGYTFTLTEIPEGQSPQTYTFTNRQNGTDYPHVIDDMPNVFTGGGTG